MPREPQAHGADILESILNRSTQSQRQYQAGRLWTVSAIISRGLSLRKVSPPSARKRWFFPAGHRIPPSPSQTHGGSLSFAIDQLLSFGMSMTHLPGREQRLIDCLSDVSAINGPHRSNPRINIKILPTGQASNGLCSSCRLATAAPPPLAGPRMQRRRPDLTGRSSSAWL